MICTQACPTASPASALVHSPRELYLRALEQEHEEILYEAYSQRITHKQLRDRDFAMSSPGASSSKFTDSDADPIDLAAYSGIDWSADAHYDERGRQLDFKETIRQRQARLEFLRRQEFARRLALKGLTDSAASAYAIKRLPPPRARPAERVNAAIKIQRAFRAHRAVRRALADLALLHNHLRALRAAFAPKLAFLAPAPVSLPLSAPGSGSAPAYSSPTSSPTSSPRRRAKQLDDALSVREYSDALHLVLLELASFGKALVAASSSSSSSSSYTSSSYTRTGPGPTTRTGAGPGPTAATHPRVLAATRALAAELRAEMERLDRAKVDVWVRDARAAARVDVLEAIEESDSEGEGDSEDGGEVDMDLDLDLDTAEEEEEEDLDEEDVPSLASDVSGESESESDSDGQEEDEDDDDAVTAPQAAALAAIFAVAHARRARKAGAGGVSPGAAASVAAGNAYGHGLGHGLGHQRTRSISSLSSLSSASASVSVSALSLNLQLSPSSSGSSSSSSTSSRRSRVSRRPSLGSISEVSEGDDEA